MVAGEDEKREWVECMGEPVDELAELVMAAMVGKLRIGSPLDVAPAYCS